MVTIFKSMLFSFNTRRRLFVAFAVLSIITAIYHLIGVFYKLDESPTWRHLLFAGVCLFCTYGLLKRPKYYIYFAVLLVIQQYYSHGVHLINEWSVKNQVHWISVFVLLVLPIGLICLIEDYKLRYGKSSE